MKKNNPRFPLFVDLTDKKIVVVGAGRIAARRVRTLCQFSGEITVVAPHACEEILALARENGTVASLLTACAAEILALSGAELLYQKIRRCFA